MALVTIRLEDKDNGKVQMTTDPPLSQLKEIKEAGEAVGEATPAVAYAIVGISAISKRHKEIVQEYPTLAKGPKPIDIIKPS